MCTVSYLPTSNGCLITSNRDESIARALAEPPVVADPNSSMLLYPRDPLGGGTWIASGKKATVCLFNGAFEPHIQKDHYRTSRGTIPIQFFEHRDAKEFVQRFDLQGIEPFSIVIYQNRTLTEIKWDEQKAHLIDHDPEKPGIWASVSLYTPEVRENRTRMFDSWLTTNPDLNQESIVGFHTSEKSDKENGLLIHRDNGLQTVSVTSVRRTDGAESNMIYRDLVSDKQYQQELAH